MLLRLLSVSFGVLARRSYQNCPVSRCNQETEAIPAIPAVPIVTGIIWRIVAVVAVVAAIWTTSAISVSVRRFLTGAPSIG